MSIGSFFRDAISNVGGQIGGMIGGSIGGPTGAAIGQRIGQKAGSLFEKKEGDSKFELVNTAIAPPRFNKMLGTSAAGMAKRASMASIKTVDADTLNAEWQYRLNRYLVTKKYYKV
jgi:hypothetical protein|tara:strand:- start:169 stop:516 length:348 start_codon:yes stop_codon:yes gene_type:complete